MRLQISPIRNSFGLVLGPQNLQVRVHEYFEVSNINSNYEITPNNLKADGEKLKLH